MLTDKQRKIVKILMIIIMVITIALIVELLVEIFAFKMRDSSYQLSFFANHFTIGICLFLIAVIAFLLPIITKRKYSDESKDGLMIIVSGLLVLAGIVAIIYSFIAGSLF